MKLRTIMLYCADEARREELAFKLRVRSVGVRVIHFASLELLRQSIAKENAHCIVVVWAPLRKVGRAAYRSLLCQKDVSRRLIEVRPKSCMDQPSLAGRVIDDSDIPGLVEALTVISHRRLTYKKRSSAEQRAVAA